MANANVTVNPSARFSAKTQQAMQELVAAFKDINEKAEAFRAESKKTIRRVTFNLVLSVKTDGIVMTEAEAARFISDLADKAGGGQAKFLSNEETSQAKRILQCSLADFAKARETHKGSDLRVLANACPTVSNKGRKAKPKGETAPETKAGETAPAQAPAQAPAPAPIQSEAAKAAVIVLRSRIDFLLQICAKNKGLQWQAAFASAKAASEALEALGLYPTK